MSLPDSGRRNALRAIIGSAPEARYDRITRLAGRFLGAPIALVCFADQDRHVVKSSYGLGREYTGGLDSFCAHVMRSEGVLVVQNAAQDPRFSDDPWVKTGPGVRFFAAAPLRTPDGTWIGALCVIQTAPSDLTAAEALLLQDLAAMVMDEFELQSTELVRSETEKVLTSVYEAAPAGISVTDEQGRFVQVNSAYCRLYGYTAEELIGRPFWEILPEEIRERAAQTHTSFVRGVVSEIPADWKVRRRDGSSVDVYLTAARLITQDGRRFRVTTITDVTGLKRSEEALARLGGIVESSQDAVIAKTPEGIIVSWNAGAERLYGYSAEEVQGKHISILGPPGGIEEFHQITERLRRGERLDQYETVRRSKDGVLLNVSLSLSPIKNAKGEVVAVSAVARDITEHKRLEEQLRTSQKMEAIALLAGGVAHDFNNLLTVIIGYSRMLLLDSPPEGSSKEYCEEVVFAAERAASLTGQLLAFSRRQLAQPKVLDLNEVVLSMDKMLRRILGEDIQLVTLLDPDLGSVRADPGQIEQVIANLVVNARDAMPDGGKLTIEIANIDLDENYSHGHPEVQPGPYVMLAVSDTGFGMTPEIQAHIFEPFFTTKERGKGTGLGLSIIHGIVKQNQGSIWLYSEPGRGATFKIYFPRIDEPAEAMAAPSASLVPGTETVLVVEDEDSVRKLLRGILQSTGYTILAARNGREAISLCTSYSGEIALMLTDVVMPEMTGPELAYRVGQVRPKMKFLYMSGYADKAIVQHDIIGSKMSFLQKPFTPQSVTHKLREVLDA